MNPKRSLSTPMCARNFVVWIGLTCTVLARPAWAALDEDQVIALAQSKMPEMEVARATDELARERVETSAPFDDPSVSWDREHAAGVNEDAITLHVPLTFWDRGARRSLSAAEGSWLSVSASSLRKDAVVEALSLYYEWASAALHLTSAESNAAQLDEAARVLAARVSAGVASDYESQRLSLAARLARSDVTEARGNVSAARERLASRLGLPATELSDPPELALRRLPSATVLIAQALKNDPAVKLTNAGLDHATDAQKRSRFSWLPHLTLSGGFKALSGAQNDTGYVLGLEAALPLFDRGQALKREARATQTLFEARSATLQARIVSDVRGRWAEYDAIVTDLENFQEDTQVPLEALLRAVKSGYREGERSIIELLDAQQMQATIELRRIALLRRAKLAEAELRASTGEFG